MKKILIAEDEPILALELKEDLTELGFKVTDVVGDGDRIISSIIREKPDVIVMDIKLFGFRSGIDAAQQIRGIYKDIPFVYLTSYPYEQVAQMIEKTKPMVYLGKPYDPETLAKTLMTVLTE